MRKLLIFVVVLVVLAVAVDVVAKRVAENRVGDRLERSFELSSQPDVAIEGFPFLAKVLGGRVPKVMMTSDRVRRGPVVLSDIEVELRDVRFSVRDLVDGSGRVRIASGVGEASLTPDSINAALADAGAPFEVVINGREIGAKTEFESAELVATVDASVEDGNLVLTGEGLPSVPIALPTLGGKVAFDSLEIGEGRATFSLTVSEMTLET